uniref:Capsid protein n=1 Tax=Acrobeloides nanus TaxID=290746 RepID=A0A914CI00_9BILA
MVGTVAENVPEKTSTNYSVKSSTAMPTSSFPPSQTTFKAITTTTTIRLIMPKTNETLEFCDKDLNTTVHLNAYYSTSKPFPSATKWNYITPYGTFALWVANFQKETSNMSDVDLYDYATRRCDELYPVYVPGRPFNQYFLSIVHEMCVNVNSKDYSAHTTTVLNVSEKTSANYSVESSTAMPTSSFLPSQTTFKAITTTTTVPFISPNTNGTLEFWNKDLNITVHLGEYYSPSKPVLSVRKWRQLTPYGVFDLFVADFQKETSNMSVLDAYDYATRCCDELYPGYITRHPLSQYFLSIVRELCIKRHSSSLGHLLLLSSYRTSLMSLL